MVAGNFLEGRCILLEAIQRGWEYKYFYNLMHAFYYFAGLLVQSFMRTYRPSLESANRLRQIRRKLGDLFAQPQ